MVNDRALNIIYKEDLEQYEDIKGLFDTLLPEDIETAYEIAKKSIIQADRWNEIYLEIGKKYRDFGYSKTDLNQWAYHRYRILMTIHESCRVIWRQCKEDLRNRGSDYYGS